MGGELGAIHGGSVGGFLEEAVEGLFVGAVRGLLEVHGIKGFTKKLINNRDTCIPNNQAVDQSSICVKFMFSKKIWEN